MSEREPLCEYGMNVNGLLMLLMKIKISCNDLGTLSFSLKVTGGLNANRLFDGKREQQ